MKKKLNRKGFTLIELIVVVAILGILMAIIVPNFMKYRETAQQKADETTIKSAVRAIQMIQATVDENTTITKAMVEEYLEGTLTDEQWSQAQTEAGLTSSTP